jgi:hypothetical protein
MNCPHCKKWNFTHPEISWRDKIKEGDWIHDDTFNEWHRVQEWNTWIGMTTNELTNLLGRYIELRRERK